MRTLGICLRASTLKRTKLLREEPPREEGMLWKLMNTDRELWRPFCIGMLPEQATENPEGCVNVAEEQREGAEFERNMVLWHIMLHGRY